MNYQLHYNLLISKAKARDSSILNYKEIHHIIPTSEGGTDQESNLVALTGREHFLAHWLLFRINPSIKSRAFSFWRMCNGRGACPTNEWPSISSRCYEEAKKAHSKAISEALSGVKKSEEHARKVGLAVKGKKRTEEQKLRLRKPHKMSSSGIRSIKQNQLKAVEKCKKGVVMMDKDTLEDIKSFKSLKEAANYVKLNSSNICVAIKSGSISSNYRWRYIDQKTYIKKPDNTENSKQNFVGDRNPNKSALMRKKISERFTGSNNPLAVRVNQYNLSGDFIKQWECMATAAKSLDIHSSNIQKCCKGIRNQTGGFKWTYDN